jgi:hypothetical protein
VRRTCAPTARSFFSRENSHLFHTWPRKITDWCLGIAPERAQRSIAIHGVARRTPQPSSMLKLHFTLSSKDAKERLRTAPSHNSHEVERSSALVAFAPRESQTTTEYIFIGQRHPAHVSNTIGRSVDIRSEAPNRLQVQLG